MVKTSLTNFSYPSPGRRGPRGPLSPSTPGPTSRGPLRHPFPMLPSPGGVRNFYNKESDKNKNPRPRSLPLPALPEGNPPNLEDVPAPNYSPPPPLPSIKKEEKKN